MIRASRLEFRYGYGAPVLTGVDLDIGVGEVVAIVGPSGSGKSTLLKLFAGDLKPSGGVLEVPPARAAGGRTVLGFAAEVEPHFESMTGEQNARFFARAGGLRRRDAAASVAELMAQLGLSEEAGRPVSHYSLESRRRLSLVEALAHRPALTLLDDPFAGLDSATTSALIHVLRLQSAKRGTVVITSPSLALVPEVADRILFLHGGRIVAGGRVAELLGSLGRATRIEIAFERRPQGLDVHFRPGTNVVSDGDPYVVETSRGAAALGEVCAALGAAGAVTKSVTVRHADLDEVFRRATGVELGA